MNIDLSNLNLGYNKVKSEGQKYGEGNNYDKVGEKYGAKGGYDVSKYAHLEGKLATANDYSEMEELDHVYLRNGMFIGADVSPPHMERLLDFSEPKKLKFINQNITWPSGAERVFLEILTNASDNVDISRRNGFDIGRIIISMDEKRITIRNGGRPIPVQMNNRGVWTPEMIFGRLRSGSHFDEKVVRTGAGLNGYGAKLTNIYSKEFIVKVGDPFNKREYYQKFTNNLKNKEEPVISEYSGEPYVEISYVMDFNRFKYPIDYYNNKFGNYDKYPGEAFYLYARHAADISYACKVPVVFNGIDFNGYDIVKYAMWMGNYNQNYIIHYEWPRGTPLINKKIGKQTVKYSKDPSILPIVELCIIDTPDAPRVTSYVNSMITRLGGVHVDAAYKQIVEKIRATINNVGRGKKSETSRKLQLMPADVKRHLTIIMSCHLNNPDFDGNTKDKLLKPRPSIKIRDDVLKKINNWEIVERLYADLEAKQYKALIGKGKKTRKKNLSGVDKGFDANNAGTEQSSQCTLFIVEGDSAKTAAVKMIENIPNGSDYYGVIPLKGKPLNVSKAGIEKYVNNQEIQLIKKYINCVEKVDYRIPGNYAKLRYGRIFWLCDSDDDGFHIGGLGMNIFFKKFISLLYIPGFFSFFRTPIVKVTKGNTTYKFYSQNELHKWEEKQESKKGWVYSYFKGLGKFEPADAREEIANPRITRFVFDERTDPQYFNLVFGKKQEDNRKKWIIDYKAYDGIEKYDELTCASFINYEVIKHSVSNVREKIPSIMDGFKDAQRKLVYGCYEKWKGKVGSTTAKKIKTANLAGYTSDVSCYHHGEKSMQGTINHMAQTHPGTNNINLLFPHGDHGSRLQNGKDASAPRYSEIKPTWVWPYLFIDEDKPLLQQKFEEGEWIEPKWYLPILPLILINGSKAIGTGFASLIPTYHPIQIAQAYIERLNGKKFEPLVPYFEGFRGSVTVVDKKKKEKLKLASPDISSIDLSGIKLNIDNNENTELNIDKNENKELDVVSMAAAFPESVDEETMEDIEMDNEMDLGLDKIGFGENTKSNLRIETKGCWEYVGNKIHVTELPIGRSFEQYYNWLVTLRDQKDKQKINIKDFKYNMSTTKADYTLEGFNNPTDKRLRLISTISLGNMVALNEHGIPQRFETVESLMEYWFNLRYPYYVKRKQIIIDSITEKIKNKQLRSRFIYAVIKGTENGYIKGQTIIIIKKKASEIIPQAQELGFNKEQCNKLLDSVKSRHYTYDELNKLAYEIQNLQSQKDLTEKRMVKDFWITDIMKFVEEYNKKGGISVNK